jgi:MFS family permease
VQARGLPEVKRLFIDLRPLRQFPHFRRLWTGYLFRLIGAQLTVTTVIYQVFTITHSNLDVGLLSLAQLGPAVLAPMVGGAIADAIDRRRLLMVTAVAMALMTCALALNASASRPSVWPLYVFSALTWGLNGIDNPTRTAVTVTLVDRGSVVSANVLRQLLGQTSNLVGPGVAGILIAVFHHDLAIVYWIDVASTAAALQAVVRLPPLMPGGGGRRFSLESIREGFSFVRSRQVIQACFAADFMAMLLGSPVSLFPYMALTRFHGGPGAYGLLSASPAVGAGLGAAISGWTGAIRHYGRWVLIAITVWGVAIVGFGLAPWLWLGVACVAIAGWADSTSALFRTAILQLETPDELRGRLSSIQAIVVQSGPMLGNTEAGLVARLANAQVSIVTGGLACLLGVAAIARLGSNFTRYEPAPSREVAADSPSGPQIA